MNSCDTNGVAERLADLLMQNKVGDVVQVGGVGSFAVYFDINCHVNNENFCVRNMQLHICGYRISKSLQ